MAIKKLWHSFEWCMLCDFYNKYETAISALFLLLAVVVQVLMQMMQEGSSQSGQRHYQEPLHVITSVFPHSGSSSPTIVNKVFFVFIISCVKFEWNLKLNSKCRCAFKLKRENLIVVLFAAVNYYFFIY